jgi:uncharacterized membrane protein HdeD (DUF308 family)
MGIIFLGIFLIVFGLNIIFGLAIPVWVSGVLAVIAGVILLVERFRITVDRKSPPLSDRIHSLPRE